MESPVDRQKHDHSLASHQWTQLCSTTMGNSNPDLWCGVQEFLLPCVHIVPSWLELQLCINIFNDLCILSSLFQNQSHFFLLILMIKYLIEIWRNLKNILCCCGYEIMCNHACELVHSNTCQENREQASTFLFFLPPHCSTAWTNAHTDTFWIILYPSSQKTGH